MAELFKEHLSEYKVCELARVVAHLENESDDFDENLFQQYLLMGAEAQGEGAWDSLTLMQRVRAGAYGLLLFFPSTSIADILIKSFRLKTDLSGWLSLIACEYIATHKQLSIDEGLDYLQQLTEFFSAEFAIRHYILSDVEKTLETLAIWVTHDNHHVRRLVSEGTRPRLPWGVRLPALIQQPELVMPLLEALRDDEEEYVRRSVANHLNDIAKDHPSLVLEVANRWLSDKEMTLLNQNKRKNRIKLVRHGCRTLFKQKSSGALSLFGYGAVDGVSCDLILSNTAVEWGGELEFEIDILLTNELLLSDGLQGNKYMVDYIIYHQKANGNLAPKVFKWLDRKEGFSKGQRFKKKHSFKAISTRKYYPGLHKIEIIINGVKQSEHQFELLER